MKTLFKTNSCFNVLKVLALWAFSLFATEKAAAQCAIIAADTVVKCYGQTYNLGSGITVSGTIGTVMYSWNGSTPAATPNKNVSPTVTTTYTLQITDGAGCTASKPVTIKVLQLPVVNAGADLTICSGQSTQLCATASSVNGAITVYNWIPGGAGQCRTVSPVAQSTYTVYVLDAAGCAATDNITVFLHPLPVVNAGADVAMCLSDGNRQMTGIPLGGTWSGGNVTPSGLFTPPANGNYTLTYSYTNSNNCTNTDQVVVTVNTPSPINGGADLELCFNAAAVQLPAVGTWSGSASVSPAGLFTPNTVGTHNLTVTDNSSGCAVTDNVSVLVLAPPTVNAGLDVSICAGQCAQLNAIASSSNGAINSVAWTGGTVSNSGILNPNACPSSSTTYTIQVTDAKSCQASDAININVNPMPVVNAGNAITVCTNSAPVTLTGQSPAGGTWTGTGVTPSGVFTPGAVGNFNLTYTYTTGANCSSSSTRTIHVIAPTPVNAGSDVEICHNSTPVQLLSGGTWSGSSWVSSSGLFTPGATGNFTLTYSVAIGQCTSTDQVDVTVLQLPNTNAGADQSVCAGVTVQLNGSSTSSNGSITNYQWNQNFVSNQNISNPTFTASTTTTLTLTATDAKNCVGTDAVTVMVNPVPVVDAGNDITICTTGGAVTLTGQSPAGGTWTGSGVSAAGVFTPSVSGDFVLTYTYTNAANCQASDTRTVHVIDPSGASAGSDIEVCLNTSAVQLASGGTWSGSTWVTSSGLFTPGAVGDFTLTYTINNGTCSSTDDIVVHVLPLPTVNAGANQNVCIGDIVQLNGSASSTNGAINTYQWNQGFVSNQHIANPTFTAASNTTLTLTATDNKNCSASAQVTVNVSTPTTVNAGNDITVCLTQSTVMLTGATPAGGTWQGAGITAAGVYTVSTPGQHTVTYTYTNAGGCISTDDLIIEVVSPDILNAGPDIDLCLNSSAVQLSGTGTWSGSTWVTSSGLFTPGAVGNFTLTYTLGNGTCTSTDQIIAHVLSLPVANAGSDASICDGNTYQLSGGATSGDGNYSYSWNNAGLLNHPLYPNPVLTTSSNTTLTLTVTDGNLCSSSDAVTITVVPMPVAGFSMPSLACANTPVHFTNSSTSAASYSWSFGNASSSTSSNPDNTYLLAGTYNVQLTAYNSLMCSSSSSADIDIIGLPVADFQASAVSGCSPLNVTFQNESSGYGVTYAWDFINSNSTDENPLPVEFTATGAAQTYNVSLTATNTCGSDIFTQAITVNPQPVAGFSTQLSTQCSPVITYFTNTSIGNTTSCLWEFGDGQNSNSMNPVPKTYTTGNTPGEYIIKLYAYNQCGSDVHEDTLTVLPNTIHTNVTPSALQGCSPLFVQFANTTVGATNHHFNFDDGGTSILQSPAYVFENAGQYEVAYIADDGCSFDTLSVTINVLQSPTISITANQSSACPLEDITFNAQTTGNATGVYWNFADGTDTNDFNPVHAFENGNTYYIGATATAQNGCEANASMMFTVHPKPDVQVSLSAETGCSPLNICTQNQTTNASVYSWNFGNGVTSTNAAPCTDYLNTTTGVNDYTVSFHAENSFGCSGDTTMTVHVQPQPTTTFSLSSNESCFHNESVHVNVTTTGSNAYEWDSDGVGVSSAMTPTFQFNGVGEHTVELTSYNSYGCTDYHSETFTIHPTPVIDIMPNPFNGCAPLSVRFANETTNGYTYQWTFGNGQTSAVKNAQIVFETPGLYDVQLTAISEHGCQSTQNYEDMIEVFALPVASFSVESDEDVLYETTVPFINNSEGATEYQWAFGNGYGSNEFEPHYNYGKGGDYEVTLVAVNEYGCESAFHKNITIDNTVYVIVPNAFTPGNDGVNDVFKPSISSFDEIYTYSFSVFNRWGEVVFETKDPKEGWLGDVNNGQYFVHNDMFNWSITISYNNGQAAKRYKGEVMVLR